MTRGRRTSLEFAFKPVGPVERSSDLVLGIEETLKRLEKEEEFNHTAYLRLVSRVGESRSLRDGKKVHASLSKVGEYDKDRYFGNLLVHMYGKCNSVENAVEVFRGITCKNVHSWNIMIAAHVRNGQVPQARNLFDSVRDKDVATWDTMISGYAQTEDAAQAKDLFDCMPVRRLLSWNTMLKAYALAGQSDQAQELYRRFPQLDVISWNTLISGLLQVSDTEAIKETFDTVPQRSVVTWSSMIGAYARKGECTNARQVFNKSPKRSVVCWTSVMTGYARAGYLVEARELFDGMPERDEMAWSTMVAAYAQNNELKTARGLLEMSPVENKRAWTVLISAYARNGQFHEAAELFERMPSPDVVAWTAVLGAYAQKNSLEEARDMFDRLSKRDSVAWTAMIGAFAQEGDVGGAMELFRTMDLEGFQADKVTLISILNVCIEKGKVAEGSTVHAAIGDRDLELDVSLGTTLFNMYARFGKLDEARRLFNELRSRDVMCWTAMIVASAQNGRNTQAAELFKEMVLEGQPPNGVTFIGILSACSHAGWLEEGRRLFLSVTLDYNVDLTCGHYVCIVDLLGRCGRVKEGEELLKSMPFVASEAAWMSLLGACKLHKDPDMASRIAREINVNMDELSSEALPLASSVLLANVFSDEYSY